MKFEYRLKFNYLSFFPSVTPGKGQYGIFESLGGNVDVRSMIVPVPTKNFAGLYIFKSG